MDTVRGRIDRAYEASREFLRVSGLIPGGA
jgi:hypothetical protein